MTWYAGPRPKDACWPKLVALLKKADNFEKEDSLRELDDSTTRIVEPAENPETVEFKTKGFGARTHPVRKNHELHRRCRKGSRSRLSLGHHPFWNPQRVETPDSESTERPTHRVQIQPSGINSLTRMSDFHPTCERPCVLRAVLRPEGVVCGQEELRRPAKTDQVARRGVRSTAGPFRRS